MSLRFIKAGQQTSIQDAGRSGFMHQGISRSGAMDPLSLQLANWLVSNPINQAAIEVTLAGPTIEFTERLSIAICGAAFDLTLNDEPVFNNETIIVTAGDVLAFAGIRQGARAYLAIAGKLDVDSTFASQSTHLTAGFGGYKGRQFQSDDVLAVLSAQEVKKRVLPEAYQPTFTGNYLLRCCVGIETEHFEQESLAAFYDATYVVSNDSNRMGLRLEGSPVPLQTAIDIISSGLTQGSIQLPPSGLPIISSVDGQTIGGYPRIANVISADLNILGQLKAGDKIGWLSVTRVKAWQHLQQKEMFLNKLLLQN
jgi:biotin-dependent carboxylase-like uncharacterized protein